jgi:hypothetical protein
VGKAILSEFVTLDGEVEDPGGDEGLKQGGWLAAGIDRGLRRWSRLWDRVLPTTVAAGASAFPGPSVLSWGSTCGRRDPKWSVPTDQPLPPVGQGTRGSPDRGPGTPCLRDGRIARDLGRRLRGVSQVDPSKGLTGLIVGLTITNVGVGPIVAFWVLRDDPHGSIHRDRRTAGLGCFQSSTVTRPGSYEYGRGCGRRPARTRSTYRSRRHCS